LTDEVADVREASAVRSRRAQAVQELALATAAMATYNLASIGLFALLPLVRHEFGLSPAEIGLLASVQFAVAGVCAFPAARTSDRFEPAAVLAVSQLLVLVALSAAAAAPSIGVFLVGPALLGLSSALLNPVANVLSVNVVATRRRGLAMSVKQTGVTIGGMAAGLTLPGLAALYGWRWALAVPAALATAVALWGFQTRTRAPAQRIVLAGVNRPVGRVRLGFFGFAMSGVQLALFGYLAIYLVDVRDVSPQVAGVALALTLGAGGVGRVGWGALSDRLGTRTRVLRGVAVGSALSLAAVPLVSDAILWPLLALVGGCCVGWNGVFHALVAESAGPVGVAHATAFAFAFLYAGSIVFPPVLGLAVETLSWTAFWGVAAVAVAGAAVLFGSRAGPVSVSRAAVDAPPTMD
jgi:predicted MFS family arabinose efflux permease